MITYAQNFEDVMLERLFAERDTGFYVDIGAGHPSRLSVTRHFYEKGWRGINIEPIANNWQLFQNERPRDTNLNVAIAGHAGRREFCEVLDDSALSTLDARRAAELETHGAVTLRYEVACVTGDSVLDQAPEPIDFIKIDVEGSEEEVLGSIDLARHAPKVVVVEAVAPVARFAGWPSFTPEAQARWHSWEPRLLAGGYVFAYFDGLNRFYVRKDLRHLVTRLAIPPGVFDSIVPDMEAQWRRPAATGAIPLAEVLEKEKLIHTLHDAAARANAALEDNAAALEAKEKVIQSLHQSLLETQQQVRALDQSASQKEAVIQALQQALSQLDIQRRERDAAMQAIGDAAEWREMRKALLHSLEEKERVIQELRRGYEAYRSAFSVFGFIVRPLNWLLAPFRAVAARARRAVMPRLGNLSQHAPRALRLPRSYSAARPPAAAPRISIVTPSFNQGAFIERTIRSVVEQGYPNLQYFVQDGGSTDNTREILEKYADRMSGWDSRKDSGQTEAINRGFAHTDGEIMAWLNSDDVLFPGALAYVADYFCRHPEVDVVYGHRILLDTSDRQIGRWIMPAHSDEVLSWADYVPQETLFWRRRIWDKAGGRVDESFRFAMDWDLLVRFRDAGARFALLPRLIGGFRIHEHQKTSAVITDVGFREMDRIRERALGRVPSRAELAKALFPYLVRHVVADVRWRIGSLFGARA